MFQLSQVFQVNDKRMRLLWHNSDFAFWIDIDGKTAWPEAIEPREIETLLINREIERIEEPFSDQIFRVVDESSAAWGKREKAWTVIKKHINDTDLFYRDTRGVIVKYLSKQHEVTHQTVIRFIRRYWQRGMTVNALLPDYTKSGGAGKRRDTTKNKLGRKRHIAEGTGCNITPDIERIFRQVILERILKNKNSSIADAYSVALNVISSTQSHLALEEFPTLRQFRYFYRREYHITDIIKSQASDIEYAKDIKPIKSTSTAETLGPGFRYQIDATIGDIYLLSEHDRSRIVGRPVIYFVIDVFSRLITGMYVGFEGPSWVSAMMAVANAANSKQDYCKSFGIEISDEDWPAIGLPDVILADKGEFNGSRVELFIEAFGGRIENAPARRGDAKGIVEQSFRVVQEKFKPYSEGVVEAVTSKKRGGIDYRLDATMTLYEFTQKIIYIVLWHNNYHVLSKYDRCENMPADIPAVPSQLWSWGISNLTGKLRTASKSLIEINLMPHSSATLSDLGIRLFGAFYTCNEAVKLGWFHRVKTQRPDKVTVAYDPRTADHIYIRPNNNLQEYWVCELTDRSRRFKGLSFWDMWLISKEERKADAKAKPVSNLSRGKLIAEIENIEKKAKSLKPELKGLSNAQRTKNIRQNKLDEKNTERSKQAFRPEKKEPSSPASVVTLEGGEMEDYSYPDMTDILFEDDNNE